MHKSAFVQDIVTCRVTIIHTGQNIFVYGSAMTHSQAVLGSFPGLDLGSFYAELACL